MKSKFAIGRLVSMVLACSAAILCGCSSTPTVVNMNVDAQAGDAVNPSVRGVASPVVVRIYQLKSNTKFNSADFLSLYEKDRETLGDELVVREERIMEPGKGFVLDAQVQPETRFLAVFAGFRDVSRAQWRDQIVFDDELRHSWFRRTVTVPVGVLVNGQRVKVELFPSAEERSKWVANKANEGGQLLREKAAETGNAVKDQAAEGARRKVDDAASKAAGKVRLPF